jgi:hypothetical protein
MSMVYINFYKQHSVGGDPEEPGTMSIDEEL